MNRIGRLKIFLGVCPGSGKTHEMLRDARMRRLEGIDVLIGCVDARGRPETEQLAIGLPILQNLNLADLVARRPELVLVDDLSGDCTFEVGAHPRWQAVLTMLEAGIDVYAALDVQQIAGRAQEAAQIIGVAAGTTVPDSLIGIADEIELIDVSLTELSRRVVNGLAGGKEQLAPYLLRGRLDALRELALGVVAEQVDLRMRSETRIRRITGPWRPSERLLVAVSGGVLSERLLRHAHRLAGALDAFWIAVHVETGEANDAHARTGVEQNLALARELGAEVVVIQDETVSHGLLRAAQQHDITQILIGRTHANLLRRLLGGGSLAGRLIDLNERLDVHVVGGEEPGRATLRWLRTQFDSPAEEYIQALAMMLAVVAAGDLLFPSEQLNFAAMAIIFLFVIVLLALRYARGPVLAATVLSVAALNFIFLEPYYSFKLEHASDAVLIALYLGIASVVGMLTARIREAAVLLQRSEAQAVASFDFASAMSRAVTVDDVCRAAMDRLSRIFGASVRILLPDGNGRLQLMVYDVGEMVRPSAWKSELGVAAWVYRNGRPAGRFTETLATAAAMYVPLLTAQGAIGVIGIALHVKLNASQYSVLSGLASQVALAVERGRLAEAAQQSSVLRESERLSQTLLNLISHELRTPVTAIVGAASSLAEPQIDADAAARRQMQVSIRESAARLDTLIDNLLDMTRLESGTLRLNSDWTDVSDLVHTVRERVRCELSTHDFMVHVESDLPLVRMDTVLIEQVLYNLLHNVALHTPHGTRVRLDVRREGAELVLTVMDRGPGLSPDDLARAFEKFHRVHQRKSTGLGLGLSICKGLVEAHGGAITAENRKSGGLRMTIRLPIESAPAIPEGHDDREYREQ